MATSRTKLVLQLFQLLMINLLLWLNSSTMLRLAPKVITNHKREGNVNACNLYPFIFLLLVTYLIIGLKLKSALKERVCFNFSFGV